jgi:hypothetical protein
MGRGLDHFIWKDLQIFQVPTTLFFYRTKKVYFQWCISHIKQMLVAKVYGLHDKTINHIHRNHFGLRDKTIGHINRNHFAKIANNTYIHTHTHTTYATLISSLNEVKVKFGMLSKITPKTPTWITPNKYVYIVIVNGVGNIFRVKICDKQWCIINHKKTLVSFQT